MRNELEYIYLVYQKGSFTKAAQALYLTQPALSIAIQKIENEIGMPLFDRNQKPLGLTAAGRIYIDKIEQMRVLETELQSQLLDLTDMNTGTLRIGATSYIISRILPPVLLAFKKEYPGISLDIVEAGAYELKELLRTGSLISPSSANWPRTRISAIIQGSAIKSSWPCRSVSRSTRSCGRPP